MPFKHSCFISYTGKGDLIKKFVPELKQAIDAEVDSDSNYEAYFDKNRLGGGQFFNEELAGAICRSFCMVVVYTPKYEKRTYCLHEYATMEDLEKERRPLIAPFVKNYGLIIPVVLRPGIGGIPEKITNSRHFYDFSEYTQYSPEIRYDERFNHYIRGIADAIAWLSNAFQRITADPCQSCDQLRIRPENEIVPWRTWPTQNFPTR